MARVTPESLIFERAENDQITKLFQNNSQVWAGSLSQAAYLDIQEKLADTEASMGNTSHWILRRPEDPMAVITSCTTYMRDAIATTGQGTRNSRAVIVTNVFTHSEHRMRGMAKLLLKKLQDHMDRGNLGNAEFSVVYGDVYMDLFQGLGWKPLPATQLRISLGQMKKLQERSHVPGAKFLGYTDVCELSDADMNTSKLRLSGHRDRKVHVQILPTKPLKCWHLMRSQLLSQHLGRGELAKQRHGASSHVKQPAWAWWVHDYRTRRLCIARLYVARRKGMEEGVRPLLEAAVIEASVCGLREVVIWEPSEQVIQAAAKLAETYGQGLSISQGERLEMVPCLRWKGGEDRDVVMEERELYGWS
ncbi:hypothetical protein BGZ61DRAFT_446698 [Ilyonectria robusta]|uniref:uncharacterized protein n=1 Tax=Ilyonectria robusta TaxID=1079257 RepID=UPI001E8E2D30|nr:uncharacterized protein BGZ61DRAFT_446698 [Ilyonectria robusta]KAH8729612.1 hypothetical protein BGZ61DRAFT_446698 [Ilyonectria robusta]